MYLVLDSFFFYAHNGDPNLSVDIGARFLVFYLEDS